LRRVADERPGVRVFGGMASGGSAPGQNRLVLDDDVRLKGAVGFALRGDLSVRSVVSQGCRPIGRTLIVTKAERNLIQELGRRPALEVLQEIFDGLTSEDQDLARSGLHVGRVINEYRESFGRGDFLVRNVMGADQSGGIAVSDLVRVGRTVQFHVRDAGTADEDLRQLVDRAKEEGPVAGALLFTCNGRGSRLFATPNHDVGVIRELLGPIPTAGFFAMGEIGPVGGQNFVHGFTASAVLFGEGPGRG
jgi:small ligand-binding sensory domain FIST